MKKLFFIFMLLCQSGYTQNVSAICISVPDSVIKACNNLFQSQLGSEMLRSCLKSDSTTGTKSIYKGGEIRLDYRMYYTFSYPGVKEATFPLTMHYAIYSGKGHLQSGRFLRFNQTDLPKNIKQKGTKIISASKARDIAIKTDSLMINANCTFVLAQYNFYWHFITYLHEHNPNGDMDNVISHNVIIDPYNGKVISNFIE